MYGGKRYFTEQSQKIGLEKTQFCLHSLGSGGAIAAAHLGINYRLFQKHRRWKTENVKMDTFTKTYEPY